MEPSVHFTDLPKPFWQHLLRKLDPDPHTKHSLRASSREIATLIDEQADLSCCLQGEHLGLETLLRIAKLSSGISTLLLPELRLFQAPHLSVTFPPGAFARLQHLCLNYRLSNLCQALAAAAASLTSVAIVPGRRKGSHWQAKLCRFLQVLQQLQQLQCLRMTLHCTQASAGLVGQLQQLRALQLSIDKTPGDSTPHPEHLFDAELWKLAIAPLTALTELSLSLPLLLSHATAAQLTMMRVEGSSVKVPLLPQLQVLRCTTLWWRLPLVVLAPCLAEVAYKRLRNLGYGSFVLPDLQDWEDEQLPPVFEGLLQQGNAAGAAGGGGAAGGNAAAAAGGAVMRSSSSALGQLQQLRLHMLGEVRLAGGGLPWLPHLSRLEFYLPDERNWDADYNDDEDIALWQNQRSVTHITIRGTFHAGGFFAPGHLDRARAAMPRLRCVLFANCGDLHSDRLQQWVGAVQPWKAWLDEEAGWQ
ncbi:hypothetical protein OEZ85_004290 [Tetradesmus obliquus]|uniref:F-box domain-containing protein n=1 Tax=Tetradesmus obliquus TaxID=3088 RepID=A0ABY8UMN8_TETOB|nr:hypothetical protein OEZ85_004290 [Tetradesmus obliquus]